MEVNELIEHSNTSVTVTVGGTGKGSRASS